MQSGDSVRHSPWTLCAAFVASALVLAACGDSGSNSAGSAQKGGASAEGAVIMNGFGGNYQKLFTEVLIPKFKAETGIDVQYTAGLSAAASMSKAIASKNAPEYDMMLSGIAVYPLGAEADIFAPLDPKIVTNLANVFDWARLPNDVGVKDSRFLIGLQYNTERFKAANLKPPTSWLDLWREDLAGHVAIYGFDNSFTQVLLPELAKKFGGSVSNMEPLWQKLKELKPRLVGIAENPPLMNDLFGGNGKAWIAYNANQQTNSTMAAGVPVVFVLPEEGAIGFENIQVLLKGAKNPQNAQKFINFLLGEWAQIEAAKFNGGMPTRKGMTLPPELVARTFYNPTGEMKVIQPDVAGFIPKLKAWSQTWTSVLK